MKNLEFIYNRHSIRKFKDETIPTEDVKEIIKAATYAANGKHLQPWHFVVIKGEDKIKELADIVENEHHSLVSRIKNEEVKNNFSKYLKYQTLFKYAPVVVLVYGGPYPTTGLDVYEDLGATQLEIEDLKKPNACMQTIGASIENMLLAASNIGYGGCWMTSANFASNVINDYVKFDKDGYYLSALVTLGVPQESELRSPKRKPLEEVLTIIE